MNSNCELATWQFEVSRTKLSKQFMAGRGKMLLQALNWPLQAQEFAKRKKLQEILSRGMLKVDQGNSPLNFISKATKNPETWELKSPDNKLSNVNMSDTTRQHRIRNKPSMSASATTVESWNHKEANNQFVDAETTMDLKTLKQPTKDNFQTEYYNLQSNFEKKTAAKPLRKPDKSRKKQTEEADKAAASFIQSKDQNQGQRICNQNDKADGNVWLDWENNVIIQGSVCDEDLPEIAMVEDNDDINDVVVDQYINALQNHQSRDSTSVTEKSKLTPQRVQQFSKLKSTSNADCTRVLPGTQPNPPKGDDRWGGSELNSNVGWGNPGNTNRNSYDDGSSLWSAGGSQLGGASWSNAC